MFTGMKRPGWTLLGLITGLLVIVGIVAIVAICVSYLLSIRSSPTTFPEGSLINPSEGP